MGLEALAKSGGKNPRTNKVDLMIAAMSDKQVDLFREVIHNEVDYSAPMIASAVQADGFNLNAEQIRHYRRKLKEGSAKL